MLATAAICYCIDPVGKRRIENRLKTLSSFPEQNPKPVIEVRLKTGEVADMNPAAAGYFPEMKKEGFAHPLFEETRKHLSTSDVDRHHDFKCEVTLGDRNNEQKYFEFTTSKY